MRKCEILNRCVYSIGKKTANYFKFASLSDDYNCVVNQKAQRNCNPFFISLYYYDAVVLRLLHIILVPTRIELNGEHRISMGNKKKYFQTFVWV